MSRLKLALAALGIGVAVVAADTVLVSLLTALPIRFEPGVQVFFAAVVAIPYLALAARSARRPLPWLAGLALTLCVEAYAIYGVLNRRDALAIGLIVFGSPLLITPVVIAVHYFQGIALRRP